ncbi:ATP-binding protein [Actinorugispora endophytica]|uniref:DNA helicase HerA-like ATPase n=1 Tax=Actinorugispora endophytica TaxID=1605990 RepID=A0A4R6V106_9ACTN|nr:hypothetical protein [Actinorugispora endophytica]TDQ53443.1 DNA helicase HerA-like ATPase [Actinorugispora endophytica]
MAVDAWAAKEAEAEQALITRLFEHRGRPGSVFRVASVPLLERAAALDRLTAPLVAAYQLGAKVFTAWTHEPGGPFTVRVGGTHGFPVWQPDAGAGPGRLLFPPGATASAEGDAAAVLGGEVRARPFWARLGGVLDSAAAPADAVPGVIEEHAPFLSATPFCLLAIAVPVEPAEVEAERARVAEALHRDDQRIERGTADLARARLEARLADHTIASAAGLWRVHALAGAPDEATAAQVAALWAAATRPPAGTAHRLVPVGAPGPLRTALAATLAPTGPFAPAAPFTAGSAALAAVCRPPVQEVPGVQARATNPFDTAVDDTGGVDFGEVLDQAGAPVGRLRVPLAGLGRHTFVHGATGAGKSQAIRHLLTEFSRLGIPWVVLEPAKSEYASGMQERLDAVRDELPDPALADVHVIRPGDPDATPAALNPLRPEPGFSYQSHLDAFTDLAVASFDAESPFPEVLVQAVDRTVREAGWDPALTETVRALADRYTGGAAPAHPDIADLVRACHEVIDAKGYGREVAGNVHGFVDMRLGTLTTGTKRAAFTAGYPLSPARALDRNVVLELQDLGTDSDRALYMGLFLSRLGQAVRVRHARDPRPGRVRNVVVVEEAHRLLRDPERLTGAAARAVESFTDLLAEVRSQGVALVIAEQIPRKIAPDAVKNTAVKCMGRTPARDDRDFVGASVGLTEEQSREVVSLPPGVFGVHAEGFDRPVLARFPHVVEKGGARARDPAPLVEDLPPWFGRAAPGGAAVQRHLSWAAQHLEDPRMVLLCELSVVSHLAHEPMPRPARGAVAGLVGPLRGADGDDLAVDVLVGTLVASAVKARRRALGAYPAEELAEAVAAAVRAVLAGADARRPDPRWRGRLHQWLAVREALRSRPDDADPHPDTALWESWGVRYVSGRTIRDQRRNLERHSAMADGELADALLGVQRPGAIEKAARSLGYGLDRLPYLLRFLANRGDFDGVREQMLGAAGRR